MINKNKQKKAWNVVGLFMIVLFLSLPFYSAQALAVSVRITKNTGQTGIPQYLNAAGDVWTVEAAVTNLGTGSDGTVAVVMPEHMEINVEGSKDEFDSCSSTVDGYLCQYVSDLSSGVTEGTYEVQVRHLPSRAGNGASINSDGSAPTIAFTQFQQRGNEILLDFTATDQPNFGVGLAKVEVVDAVSGSVLETYTPAVGTKSFNYKSDGTSGGKLLNQEFLGGEGLRKIKIRAEDTFGHQGTSVTKLLQVDFIAPDPLNVSFIHLGDFVGTIRLRTAMEVYVKESNVLQEVKGSSEQVEFANPVARCAPVLPRENHPESEDLWKCTWDVVEVTPAEQVTVLVHAEDEFGAVGEKSLSKTFTQDTSPPAVEFFGTEKQYRGSSYIKDGENKILLRVAETGGLMTASGIRANLGSLGGGIDVEPEVCVQIENIFACNWTVSGTSVRGLQSVRMSLNTLRDAVGNEGEVASSVRDLLVDTGKPKIHTLEILAIGADGREKDFFQSGDHILFHLNVSEPRSGLVFTVDLSDVAEVEEEVFTEESCSGVPVSEVEVQWDCAFLTNTPLGSGHESSASLRVRLEDSVGNVVEEWPEEKQGRMQGAGPARSAGEAAFIFEKKGVVDEAAPDYWKTGKVETLHSFINIASTQFAPLRMPVNVELKANSPRVANNLRLLEVQAGECTPTSEEEAPALQRTYVYGGISNAAGRAVPTLVMEFQQFDGRAFFGIEESEEIKEYLREYTCQLKLYSEVGANAVAAAEVQDVPVTVRFALSKLGAADEALDEKIAEARERADFALLVWTDEAKTILSVVGYLNDVLKVLTAVTQAANLVIAVAGTGQKVALGLLDTPAAPAGPPLYAQMTGVCGGTQATIPIIGEVISGLETVTGVLSCTGGDTTLGKYQQEVTKWYNGLLLESFNALTFGVAGGGLTGFIAEPLQTHSIMDNFLVSVIGLCFPGVVYNLDKLHEIYCREVFCLENEVAGGVPASLCAQMRDQQICKYFFGELLELVPLLAGLDGLLEFLKSLLSDPIATGYNLALAGCIEICPKESFEVFACNVAFVIRPAIVIFNTVTTALQTVPAIGQSYCAMIEDAEEAEEEAAEEGAAEQPTAVPTAEGTG